MLESSFSKTLKTLHELISASLFTVHSPYQTAFACLLCSAALWFTSILSQVVREKNWLVLYYNMTSDHARSRLKRHLQVEFRHHRDREIVKYGCHSAHYQEVSPGRLSWCCTWLYNWKVTEGVEYCLFLNVDSASLHGQSYLALTLRVENILTKALNTRVS